MAHHSVPYSRNVFLLFFSLLPFLCILDSGVTAAQEERESVCECVCVLRQRVRSRFNGFLNGDS